MSGSKTRIACAVVAAAFASAALGGCALIQLKLREPGQFNKGFPEDVAYEYDCDRRPLPWFQVEEAQLLPQTLHAGDEFNHRLEYVMCPTSDPTAVVRGTMHRRILYRGKPVLEESSPHELMPGRWVLDTFITLPRDAKPGIYALQAKFESASGSFDSKATFLVEE